MKGNVLSVKGNAEFDRRVSDLIVGEGGYIGAWAYSVSTDTINPNASVCLKSRPGYVYVKCICIADGHKYYSIDATDDATE